MQSFCCHFFVQCDLLCFYLVANDPPDYYKKANQVVLCHVIRAQLLGFGFLVAMVCAEIFSYMFNN